MALGNLVGEIGFDTKHLYSAYILGVGLDAIMLIIPIIGAATQSSGLSCNVWFDGYFASVYLNLSQALEYSIVMGSIVINWCIYVTSVGITSRMLWAMAQPYFVVLRYIHLI